MRAIKAMKGPKHLYRRTNLHYLFMAGLVKFLTFVDVVMRVQSRAFIPTKRRYGESNFWLDSSDLSVIDFICLKLTFVVMATQRAQKVK